MLTDAVLVLAVGMGGVFVFLVALCLIMLALIRMAPVAVDTRPVPDDPTLVTVLQAAVTAYEADVGASRPDQDDQE